MTDNEEIIEVEISDEIFLRLAKMAHEKDITFNQLVNHLLREYIEGLEGKNETPIN